MVRVGECIDASARKDTRKGPFLRLDIEGNTGQYTLKCTHVFICFHIVIHGRIHCICTSALATIDEDTPTQVQDAGVQSIFRALVIVSRITMNQ